jgi:hypothetical protein
MFLPLSISSNAPIHAAANTLKEDGEELLSKINGTSNIESLMQHTRMPNHALKKNYLVGMIPGSSWFVTTN